MALKEGSFTVEHYEEKFEEDFSFVEENYQEIESEFIKTNYTSMEVIETWSESYNKTDTLNMTIDREPLTTHALTQYDVEFSIPVVLVMQMYTTQRQDKIAWAETFYDFIIYKDKDGDGIYSAGETGNPSHSGFGLTTSDERVGTMSPQAINWRTYSEHTPIFTNLTTNSSNHYVFPHDKTVSEIASTIEFSPPVLTDTNTVSWDINYPQFPVYGSINDKDKAPSESYSPGVNATYDLMSPGDFSYQFDYNLNDTQADLDFTLNMSKIISQIEKSARQGNNILLVAPNGMGKTVIALSALLPLAQDKGFKIVYLCRTHAQSSRVIQELNNIESSLSDTGKSVAGISIRGRNDMCLNNVLLRLRTSPSESMAICADLRKNNNCVYYRKVKKINEGLKKFELFEFKRPVDAEELMDYCKEHKYCPYFLTKYLLKEMTVVVCNYQWIFNPDIRFRFLQLLDTNVIVISRNKLEKN